MERLVVRIGGLGAEIRTADPAFRRLIEARYAGFLDPGTTPDLSLSVDLVAPGPIGGTEEVRVSRAGALWRIERGDFLVEYDPIDSQGTLRQSANPYGLDSVLRILHSLVLAGQGGFLLHAASAVRGGRALVLAGVSGAGKTTIARLAPPEVRLLTDEVSYIRAEGAAYVAYGTPFAGELAEPGENIRAPVGGLYFLEQSPLNRLEPVGPAEAVRRLLRNILFFAEDLELVRTLFDSACRFVASVPVYRLSFLPSAEVWELLR